MSVAAQTTPIPAKSAFNPELEGVRGVACLCVALSHVFYLTHLDPTVTLPAWLRTIEAGHSGVLVFFMLSGYLIGWTNTREYSPARRRAYVLRRLIRLAPIYYVAMLLTVAVIWLRGDHGQIRTIAGSLLGLQNFNDYFGFTVSVPMSNGPLWSLNYELLYYAVFIAVWRFLPATGWIFLPAFAATIAVWFKPEWMPLFLGSYACGWLFWAAGWWLSRQPELPAESAPQPVLTWLLLIFAGHHLEGMMRLLNAAGLHSNDAGMVTLGQLGELPAIMLLIAAVTRRQLPARKFLTGLAWLFCLAPLGVMVAGDRLLAHPGWLTAAVAVGLAILAWPWRRTAWLRRFEGLGAISYGFYVVHFPLLFVVERLPLPRGTLPAYFVRIIVWAMLALGLAWLLERKFQPWAKSRLPQPRATGS